MCHPTPLRCPLQAGCHGAREFCAGEQVNSAGQWQCPLQQLQPHDHTGMPHTPPTTTTTHHVIGSYDEMVLPCRWCRPQAIADGLRRDFAQAQGRRVFSLSRSSFAGQQRTGATLWSGDITSAWDTLRRQVAASLNFQLSGMPYWSEVAAALAHYPAHTH